MVAATANIKPNLGGSVQEQSLLLNSQSLTGTSTPPMSNFQSAPASLEAFPEFDQLLDYYPAALFVNDGARWSTELEFCVEDFLGKNCATSPTVSFGGTLQFQATIRPKGIDAEDKSPNSGRNKTRKQRSSASTQIAIVLNISPQPSAITTCPFCRNPVDFRQSSPISGVLPTPTPPLVCASGNTTSKDILGNAVATNTHSNDLLSEPCHISKDNLNADHCNSQFGKREVSPQCICKTYNGFSTLSQLLIWVVPAVYYEMTLINFYDPSSSFVKWGLASFSHLNPSKVIRDFAPRSLVQRGYLAKNDTALIKIRLHARFDDPRFRVSPVWFHQNLGEASTKRRRRQKENEAALDKTEEVREKVVRWLNDSREFRAIETPRESPFGNSNPLDVVATPYPVSADGKNAERSATTVSDSASSNHDDQSSISSSSSSEHFLCLPRHHHLHYHACPPQLKLDKQIGQLMGTPLQSSLHPYQPHAKTREYGTRKDGEFFPQAIRLRPPGASHDWRMYEPIFHPILRMDFLRVMAECLPFDYADVFQAILRTQKRKSKLEAKKVQPAPDVENAFPQEQGDSTNKGGDLDRGVANVVEGKNCAEPTDDELAGLANHTLFPLNLPSFVGIMCYTGDTSSEDDENTDDDDDDDLSQFSNRNKRSKSKHLRSESATSSDLATLIPSSCTLVEVRTTNVLLAVLMKRLIGNCRESPSAHVSRYNLYILIRLIAAIAGYDSISEITNVQPLVLASVPAIVEAFHHCYEVAGRKMVETQRRTTFHYRRYLTQLKIQRQLRLKHLSSPYLTVGSEMSSIHENQKEGKSLLKISFAFKQHRLQSTESRVFRMKQSTGSVCGDCFLNSNNSMVMKRSSTQRHSLVRYVPLHAWKSWLLRNAIPGSKGISKDKEQEDKKGRKKLKDRKKKNQKKRNDLNDNAKVGASQETEARTDLLMSNWNMPKKRKDQWCTDAVNAFRSLLKVLAKQMERNHEVCNNHEPIEGSTDLGRVSFRVYCKVKPKPFIPRSHITAVDLQHVSFLDVPQAHRGRNEAQGASDGEEHWVEPKLYFCKRSSFGKELLEPKKGIIHVKRESKSLGSFFVRRSDADQRVRPSTLSCGYHEVKARKARLAKMQESLEKIDVSSWILPSVKEGKGVSMFNPLPVGVERKENPNGSVSATDAINEVNGEIQQGDTVKNSSIQSRDENQCEVESDEDVHPAFFSRYLNKKRRQQQRLKALNGKDESVFAGLACHELLGMQRVRCVFEIQEITRYQLLTEEQTEEYRHPIIDHDDDSDSDSSSTSPDFHPIRNRKNFKRMKRISLAMNHQDNDSENESEFHDEITWNCNQEVFEERKSSMQLALPLNQHSRSLEGAIYDYLAERTILDHPTQQHGIRDVRLCREFTQTPPVMTFTFQHLNGSFQPTDGFTIPDILDLSDYIADVDPSRHANLQTNHLRNGTQSGKGPPNYRRSEGTINQKITQEQLVKNGQNGTVSSSQAETRASEPPQKNTENPTSTDLTSTQQQPPPSGSSQAPQPSSQQEQESNTQLPPNSQQQQQPIQRHGANAPFLYRLYSLTAACLEDTSEGSVSSGRICSFIREHPCGTWVLASEGLRGVMPLPQIRGFFDCQHAHAPFLRNARGRHPLGSVSGASGREVSEALLSILSRIEGSELLLALTKDELRSRNLVKQKPQEIQPADGKKKKKKSKNRDVTIDFCQQLFKRPKIPILFGEFPTQVVIRTPYGGFRCVPPIDESRYLEALLKVFRMQVAVELQSFSGTPSTLRDGPIVDASSLAGLRLPIMPAPLDLGSAATGLITASSALKLAMIELRKQSVEWFTQWRKQADENGPLALLDQKKAMVRPQATTKQMQHQKYYQQQQQQQPQVPKKLFTGKELRKSLEELEEGKKKIGFVNLLEKDPTLLFSSYWPFDKGFIPLQVLFVRVDIEEQLLDMPVAEKLPPAPPLFGPLQPLNGIVVGASAVNNPSQLLVTDAVSFSTSDDSHTEGGRSYKTLGSDGRSRKQRSAKRKCHRSKTSDLQNCDIEQLSIGGHNHGTVTARRSKQPTSSKKLCSNDRRRLESEKRKLKKRKELLLKYLKEIVPDLKNYDRRDQSSFKRIVSTCLSMGECSQRFLERRQRTSTNVAIDGRTLNHHLDESISLDQLIAARIDAIESDDSNCDSRSTIETVATSQISHTYLWDWDWWNPANAKGKRSKRARRKSYVESDVENEVCSDVKSSVGIGTLRITETRRRRSLIRQKMHLELLSRSGQEEKGKLEKLGLGNKQNFENLNDVCNEDSEINKPNSIEIANRVCRCIPDVPDLVSCKENQFSSDQLIDVFFMTPKDFDDINFAFDSRCQRSVRNGVGVGGTGGGNGGWMWLTSLFGNFLTMPDLPLHWKYKLPISKWIRVPSFITASEIFSTIKLDQFLVPRPSCPFVKSEPFSTPFYSSKFSLFHFACIDPDIKVNESLTARSPSLLPVDMNSPLTIMKWKYPIGTEEAKIADGIVIFLIVPRTPPRHIAKDRLKKEEEALEAETHSDHIAKDRLKKEEEALEVETHSDHIVKDRLKKEEEALEVETHSVIKEALVKGDGQETAPINYLIPFDPQTEVLKIMKHFDSETLFTIMLGPIIIPKDLPIAYHYAFVTSKVRQYVRILYRSYLEQGLNSFKISNDSFIPIGRPNIQRLATSRFPLVCFTEIGRRFLKPLPLLAPLTEFRVHPDSSATSSNDGLVLVFQDIPFRGYIYCHGCGMGTPRMSCHEFGGIFCSRLCAERGSLGAKVVAKSLDIPLRNMGYPEIELPRRITLGGVQRDTLHVNGDYCVLRTQLWKSRPIWGRMLDGDTWQSVEDSFEEMLKSRTQLTSPSGKLRRFITYVPEVSSWQVTGNLYDNPIALNGPDWISTFPASDLTTYPWSVFRKQKDDLRPFTQTRLSLASSISRDSPEIALQLIVTMSKSGSGSNVAGAEVCGDYELLFGQMHDGRNVYSKLPFNDIIALSSSEHWIPCFILYSFRLGRWVITKDRYYKESSTAVIAASGINWISREPFYPESHWVLLAGISSKSSDNPPGVLHVARKNIIRDQDYPSIVTVCVGSGFLITPEIAETLSGDYCLVGYHCGRPMFRKSMFGLISRITQLYLVFYPQQSQWNIIEVNYSDEGMNSIIKLFGSPTTLLDSPDIPILRHGVDTIILNSRIPSLVSVNDSNAPSSLLLQHCLGEYIFKDLFVGGRPLYQKVIQLHSESESSSQSISNHDIDGPLQIPHLFYDIHEKRWKIASFNPHLTPEWKILICSVDDKSAFSFLPTGHRYQYDQPENQLKWKCDIKGSNGISISVRTNTESRDISNYVVMYSSSGKENSGSNVSHKGNATELSSQQTEREQLQPDEWLTAVVPDLRCFAPLGISLGVPLINSLTSDTQNKKTITVRVMRLALRDQILVRHHAGQSREGIHDVSTRFLPIQFCPPCFNPSSCLSSYLVSNELLAPRPPNGLKPLIGLIAMVVRKQETLHADSTTLKGLPNQTDISVLVSDLIAQLKHDVDKKAKERFGKTWKSIPLESFPGSTVRRSVLFSDSIQLTVGVHGGTNQPNNSATLKSSTRLSELWKDLLRIENDANFTKTCSDGHSEGRDGKSKRGVKNKRPNSSGHDRNSRGDSREKKKLKIKFNGCRKPTEYQNVTFPHGSRERTTNISLNDSKNLNCNSNISPSNKDSEDNVTVYKKLTKTIKINKKKSNLKSPYQRPNIETDQGVSATYYAFAYPLPEDGLVDSIEAMEQYKQSIRDSLCKVLLKHFHRWETRECGSELGRGSGSESASSCSTKETGDWTTESDESIISTLPFKSKRHQHRRSISIDNAGGCDDPASAVVLLTVTMGVSPEQPPSSIRIVNEPSREAGKNSTHPINELTPKDSDITVDDPWVDIVERNSEVCTDVDSSQVHRRKFGNPTKYRVKVKLPIIPADMNDREDEKIPLLHLNDPHSMEKGLALYGLWRGIPQSPTDIKRRACNDLIAINSNSIPTPPGWPRLDCMLLLQQHLTTATELTSLGLNERICSFFKTVQNMPPGMTINKSSPPTAENTTIPPNSIKTTNVSVNGNQTTNPKTSNSETNEEVSCLTNTAEDEKVAATQSGRQGTTSEFDEYSEDWEFCPENINGKRNKSGKRSSSPQQQDKKDTSHHSMPTKVGPHSCACCLGSRQYETAMKAAAKHQATAARLNQKMAAKNEQSKQQPEDPKEPSLLAKTLESLQGKDAIAKFVAQEFGEEETKPEAPKKKKKKWKVSSIVPVSKINEITNECEEAMEIATCDEKMDENEIIMKIENPKIRKYERISVGVNDEIKIKEVKVVNEPKRQGGTIERKSNNSHIVSSNASSRLFQSTVSKKEDSSCNHVLSEERAAALRNAEVLLICSSVCVLFVKGKMRASELRKALLDVNVDNCEVLQRLVTQWTKASHHSADDLGRKRSAKLCMAGGVSALLSAVRNDSSGKFSLINALKWSLLIDVGLEDDPMCQVCSWDAMSKLVLCMISQVIVNIGLDHSSNIASHESRGNVHLSSISTTPIVDAQIIWDRILPELPFLPLLVLRAREVQELKFDLLEREAEDLITSFLGNATQQTRDIVKTRLQQYRLSDGDAIALLILSIEPQTLNPEVDNLNLMMSEITNSAAEFRSNVRIVRVNYLKGKQEISTILFWTKEKHNRDEISDEIATMLDSDINESLTQRLIEQFGCRGTAQLLHEASFEVISKPVHVLTTAVMHTLDIQHLKPVIQQPFKPSKTMVTRPRDPFILYSTRQSKPETTKVESTQIKTQLDPSKTTSDSIPSKTDNISKIHSSPKGGNAESDRAKTADNDAIPKKGQAPKTEKQSKGERSAKLEKQNKSENQIKAERRVFSSCPAVSISTTAGQPGSTSQQTKQAPLSDAWKHKAAAKDSMFKSNQAEHFPSLVEPRQTPESNQQQRSGVWIKKSIPSFIFGKSSSHESLESFKKTRSINDQKRRTASGEFRNINIDINDIKMDPSEPSTTTSTLCCTVSTISTPDFTKSVPESVHQTHNPPSSTPVADDQISDLTESLNIIQASPPPSLPFELLPQWEAASGNTTTNFDLNSVSDWEDSLRHERPSVTSVSSIFPATFSLCAQKSADSVLLSRRSSIGTDFFPQFFGGSDTYSGNRRDLDESIFGQVSFPSSLSGSQYGGSMFDDSPVLSTAATLVKGLSNQSSQDFNSTRGSQTSISQVPGLRTPFVPTLNGSSTGFDFPTLNSFNTKPLFSASFATSPSLTSGEQTPKRRTSVPVDAPSFSTFADFPGAWQDPMVTQSGLETRLLLEARAYEARLVEASALQAQARMFEAKALEARVLEAELRGVAGLGDVFGSELLEKQRQQQLLYQENKRRLVESERLQQLIKQSSFQQQADSGLPSTHDSFLNGVDLNQQRSFSQGDQFDPLAQWLTSPSLNSLIDSHFLSRVPGNPSMQQLPQDIREQQHFLYNPPSVSTSLPPGVRMGFPRPEVSAHPSLQQRLAFPLSDASFIHLQQQVQHPSFGSAESFPPSNMQPTTNAFPQ